MGSDGKLQQCRTHQGLGNLGVDWDENTCMVPGSAMRLTGLSRTLLTVVQFSPGALGTWLPARYEEI